MLNENLRKERNIFFSSYRSKMKIIDRYTIICLRMFSSFYLYDHSFTPRIYIVKVPYRPDIKQTVASGYCSVLYIVHEDVNFSVRSKRCLPPAMGGSCSLQLRMERSWQLISAAFQFTCLPSFSFTSEIIPFPFTPTIK